MAGFTGNGGFAPYIERQRVTLLGQAAMPDPARASWDELMNGSMDSQYVEIEGIVTSVHADGVALFMIGGRIQLFVEGWDAAGLARFQNARVRLRGGFSAAWDGATHQIKSGQVALNNPVIAVDQWAPPDLFATRSKRVVELRQFDAQAGALERVRVAGLIVHRGPGSVS